MVFCEVIFDNNPNSVYYSGQTLSGVINITNEKCRKVKALILRIEGFAKCKWTETKGSGRHRRTIIYSGREDYLNTVTYLLGNYNGVETELSAGLHQFNFSCALPIGLPTSFESKYGNIRYQIKVEFERPWKLDLKYSFGFTVIKVYDLNCDGPAIRAPQKAETTKNFFLGLSSKSVFISAKIPARGFVAGETVPITITTNNESNIDVKEIKVSLKKIIHYNSQTPTTKARERVESTSEIRHSGVQRKSKENTVVNMIIPAVPPTNIASCSIIQVTYMIQVVAKVSGMHFSPLVRLPIILGTVPLNHQPVQPMLSTVNSTEGAMSLTPAPAALFASTGSDLPPPSYQEAMGMASSEADNDDGLTEEKPFSPLYPVLNFGIGSTNLHNNLLDSAAPPPYNVTNNEHGHTEKEKL